MATAENGTLTITIAGKPDAVITGADYLTWGAKKRIASAGQKETAQGLTTDFALMFDAMVTEYARQPETRGHIHDHRGALIPFAPDVIADHAKSDDVEFLALELGQFFYPEIFGSIVLDEDESADPNEEAPAEPIPTPAPDEQPKPRPARTQR
jgi:hypothetical protein